MIVNQISSSIRKPDEVPAADTESPTLQPEEEEPEDEVPTQLYNAFEFVGARIHRPNRYYEIVNDTRVGVDDDDYVDMEHIQISEPVLPRTPSLDDIQEEVRRSKTCPLLNHFIFGVGRS